MNTVVSTQTEPKGPPAWLRVAVLVVALKVVVFLTLVLSLSLLPPIFDGDNYLKRFHWPADEAPSHTWMLKTWDSAHYLYLSESGYSDAGGSAAFFPLWPLVIKVASPLFGGSLWAALILANIFSVAGWTIFHRFGAHLTDERTADTGLLLALAYPGAIYFCLPYTESLFLLITVAVFYLVASKRLVAAALLSVLAPMTRAVGIFLFIPLAWQAYRDWRNGERSFWHLGLAFAPAVGLGLTLVIMWIATGNPWIGFEAQARYASEGTVFKVLQPLPFLRSFVDVWGVHGVLHSGIDRVFFVVMMFGVVLTARFEKTVGPMTVYSALMIIVPAMTLSFMSFTRYPAVVFPVFLATGCVLAAPSKRYLRWVVVALFVMLQFFFLLRHINSHWAA